MEQKNENGFKELWEKCVNIFLESKKNNFSDFPSTEFQEFQRIAKAVNIPSEKLFFDKIVQNKCSEDNLEKFKKWFDKETGIQYLNIIWGRPINEPLRRDTEELDIEKKIDYWNK
jgi:hypothetical protein